MPHFVQDSHFVFLVRADMEIRQAGEADPTLIGGRSIPTIRRFNANSCSATLPHFSVLSRYTFAILEADSSNTDE